MPPPCSPGRLPDPRLDRRPGEAEGSWKVANLKLEPTMRRGRANHFARWAGWPVPCVRPAGYQEASPSPVYGAALLMRFGLTVHPGFKSPSLRPLTRAFPMNIAGRPLIVFGAERPQL